MICDMKIAFLNVLGDLSEKGFSIGVGFREGKPAWAHSAYAEEWINCYVNRGYLIQDATIVHGQKVQGHFTWAELEALYPEDPVFEAARGHGLKHGNTLSLHVNGSITIVSCSGPKWNEEQLVKARSAAAALHFWNLPEPEFPVIVSEGVLETLRLMAAGLRDQEIAIELGVKIETIRQRRNLAYQRTGTKTPAHLVSFVIKNGWI